MRQLVYTMFICLLEVFDFVSLRLNILTSKISNLLLTSGLRVSGAVNLTQSMIYPINKTMMLFS